MNNKLEKRKRKFVIIVQKLEAIKRLDKEALLKKMLQIMA
jgi:translation initiation factor 1 (eIF-1/SUI1)